MEHHILVMGHSLKRTITLSDVLRAAGYMPVSVAQGQPIQTVIDSARPTLALIELTLADSRGMLALQVLRDSFPDIECIALVEAQSMVHDAISQGVYGYLYTPYDSEALLLMIRRAIEYHETRQTLNQHQSQDQQYYRVLDALNDPLHVVDTDLRFVLINQKWAQWVKQLGLATPVPGQYLFDVYGYLSDNVRDEYQQVLTTGQTLSTQERTRIHNREFITETRKIPVFDGDNIVQIVTVIHDITAARHTADTLRAERDRAQTYLDMAGVMFVALDRAGNITLINRRGCDILGYNESDLLGENWFQTCLPLDIRDNVQVVFDRLIAGEIVLAEYVENEVLTRNGETRIIAWHNTVFRDETGYITGTLSSGEDVTERNRAERALQWELTINAALARLYKPLISPMSSLDEIANLVLLQARGLTSSEHGYVSAIDPINGDNVCYTFTNMLDECAVQGEERRIIFPLNEEALYPALWGHALNTLTPFYTNTPQTHPAFSNSAPEGHILLDNFLSVPVLLNGKPVGQIALANSARSYGERELDAITRLAEIYALAIQRVRANEALQESENRLRQIVQQMPYPIEVCEPDGTASLVNPEFLRMFGIPAADRVVEQYNVFDDPFITDLGLMDDVRRVYNGETIFLPELIIPLDRADPKYGIQQKPGQTIHEVTMFPVFHPNESLQNVVTIWKDVTDRVRAEAAEREHRAMAEALADTAAIINSTLDFDEVFDRILSAIARVVPHDGANIMLIDEQANAVRIVRYCECYAENGLDTPPVNVAFALDHLPHLRQMIENQQPLIIPDTSDYPGWQPSQGDNWLRSYAGAPIRVEGKIIGVLNADSATPNFFVPEQAAQLQAFADQAAIAIHNAQLYQRLESYSEDLAQAVAERTDKLRQSTERVEGILHNSSDVIMLVQVDGTIQQVNPAFVSVFGTPANAIVGQSLVELCIPAHAERLATAMEAVVDSQQPQRIEITAQRADSSTFDADVALSPIIRGDQQVIDVICSLRDVTNQKQLEHQLRQMLARQMEINEMRARFVSMAAHDLRNPLAVIKTSSGILARYEDRLPPSKKAEQFDRLRASVEVMIELLDDVLTVSMGEAGQLSFNPDPVELVGFCRQLVHEAGMTAVDAQEIIFSASCDHAERVVDKKLVRHIISNLLSNALKYSPAEGRVQFSLSCDDQHVIFQIQDEGIGISEEDRRSLFEPFKRGKNVGGIPGTGLGLAIVKRSVDLHNGTITCDSQEGVGTTFTVTLPYT